MIELLNPKPYIKRAVIYISNSAVELTVEMINGLKKTERGFKSILIAKKYYNDNFICNENKWSDEKIEVVNHKPKTIKKKLGRPKKRGRPVKKAAKLKTHKHLTN